LVEKQENTKLSGSRVYRLDRECYVIYMGKGDRQYRPFLRIGTSEHLPEDIRRHIGSVVLPDRMTGDYFEELDCLEKPITRHMHYVGSPELIKAVRHFIRKEEIELQPIESVGDGIPEESGAKVHFFRDGNLRVFIDGHRLFDLLEREKTDDHMLHVLQRVNDLISQDPGSIDRRDLKKPGFIRVPGAGTLLYNDGIIESLIFRRESLGALASRMIPPQLLLRYGGPSNRDALFDIIKWHHVENRKLEFVMEDLDAGTGPTTDLEADLLDLLNHIDAKARAHKGIAFDPALPMPRASVVVSGYNRLRLQAEDPAEVGFSIDLPDGSRWSAADTPLILPGVPYTLEASSSRSFKSAVNKTQGRLEHLMGSTRRSAVKQYADLDESGRRKLAEQMLTAKDDPIGRLALLAWMWNRSIVEGETAPLKPADFPAIESLQDELLFPFSGLLVEREGEYDFALVLASDLTRGEIKQRQSLRDKVLALVEWKRPTAEFEAERRRLSQALRSLQAIQAGRVPPAAETPEDGDGVGTTSPADAGERGTRSVSEAEAVARAGGRHSPGESDAVARAAAGDRRQRGWLPWILAALALGALAVVIWLLFLREPATEPRLAGETGTDSQQTSDDASPADDAQNAAADDSDAEDSAESSAAGNDGSSGSDAAVDDDGGADGGSAAESDGNGADSAADSAVADAPGPASDDNSAESAGEDGNAGSPAGAIEDSVWTPAEILRVANWIAVNNGYALIGEESDLKSNPDWIFTSNRFVLPGGDSYTVIDGDMIWTIADAYLTREFNNSGQSIDEFRVNIENLNYNHSGD
jgi:hypothetical protein